MVLSPVERVTLGRIFGSHENTPTVLLDAIHLVHGHYRLMGFPQEMDAKEVVMLAALHEVLSFAPKPPKEPVVSPVPRPRGRPRKDRANG
jgi:hypothetical protein